MIATGKIFSLEKKKSLQHHCHKSVALALSTEKGLSASGSQRTCTAPSPFILPHPHHLTTSLPATFFPLLPDPGASCAATGPYKQRPHCVFSKDGASLWPQENTNQNHFPC